jgi:integrase
VSARYRIRRRLGRLGIPLLQVSSGARTDAEHRRREAVVDKLVELSQVEALRALADGTVTCAELVDLDRRGQLGNAGVTAIVRLRRPLWVELERAVEAMTCGDKTKARYRVSFVALRTKAARWFPADAVVEALASAPWAEIHRAWGGSAADWNHLRRAISHAMTVLMGDKYDPIRRALVASMPRRAERERVPELAPEDFWRVVAQVREDVRPAFVALVVTGMRVGEYLACTTAHLRPATTEVEVPGTKTAGSARRVAVDAGLWPWIEAAIPSRVQYKALRQHWRKACDAAGVRDVRLHDLRHLHGQLADDAGVSEAQIQRSLGHATPAMTRRYTQRRGLRTVATGIAAKLGQPETPHDP